MEKTLDMHLNELRETIAKRIEDEIENMMPPVDSAEFASYETAMWCVAVVRGEK